MDVSVIIPIKDERANVPALHERLHAALDPTGKDYEIIVIDDGSTDGSFELLEERAASDPRLRVVRLRRNFGQSAAMQAGIDYASGQVIVTMDGDLQNDPADIPLLLQNLEEGYDAVLGLRAKRQDSWLIRKLPSLCANWLIRKVTGSPIHDMGCTIRAIRRDLAEELPLYGEMHRFVPVLAQHYGARLKQVPVRHHPRVAGHTKYTLTRTIRVLLDLITVKFLDRYLTRPMHLMGTAGLLCMGLGVVTLLTTIWIKFQYGTSMVRNPLLHLTVMLELIGVQFISMGLLGEVLARTYFESQGKKAYAVRNTVNLEMRDQRKAA